jgi:hypothetical protein
MNTEPAIYPNMDEDVSEGWLYFAILSMNSRTHYLLSTWVV